MLVTVPGFLQGLQEQAMSSLQDRRQAHRCPAPSPDGQDAPGPTHIGVQDVLPSQRQKERCF